MAITAGAIQNDTTIAFFRDLLARRPVLAARLKSLRIATLLATLIILNLVDLAYTLFAHRIDALTEMNPLAARLLNFDLTQSLVAYKLLMVLVSSAMLWRVRASRWALPACWFLVAAYAALGVTWYLWVRDVTFAYEAQIAVNSAHHFIHR